MNRLLRHRAGDAPNKAHISIMKMADAESAVGGLDLVGKVLHQDMLRPSLTNREPGPSGVLLLEQCGSQQTRDRQRAFFGRVDRLLVHAAAAFNRLEGKLKAASLVDVPL